METRSTLRGWGRRHHPRFSRRRTPAGVDPGPMKPTPLDLSRLRVFPLGERDSLTRVEDILISPDAAPAPIPEPLAASIRRCATDVLEARSRGAGVILIYGAHLLRNGAALLLSKMMDRGWITHLATNGAGTIHDWEYSWLGRSTESVRANVA